MLGCRSVMYCVISVCRPNYARSCSDFCYQLYIAISEYTFATRYESLEYVNVFITTPVCDDILPYYLTSLALTSQYLHDEITNICKLY